MYKIAICDTDEILCFFIEKVILDYGKRISELLMVEVFFSGDELYQYLQAGEYYDFIFLDVDAAAPTSGVQIGKRIREDLGNNTVQIIYLSSVREYADQLFRARPMNLLGKPPSAEIIIDTLCTAMRLSQQEQKMFTYQIGKEFFKIQIREILYFKGKRREVEMITLSEKITFYGSLKSIHQKLKSSFFLYSGRSHLVNYQYIKSFTPTELTLFNDTKLPVGKGKYEELKILQEKFKPKSK